MDRNIPTAAQFTFTEGSMTKPKLKVINEHLVLKKRHKRVLVLMTAESRFRVLERINGRPYDPDDAWQDEGGSG